MQATLLTAVNTNVQTKTLKSYILPSCLLVSNYYTVLQYLISSGRQVNAHASRAYSICGYLHLQLQCNGCSCADDEGT